MNQRFSLRRGDLMNASMVLHKMKRYVAVVLMLLILGFAIEPISSVASAHSSMAAAAAAQTRRRVRRKRSFWKKHRDKLTVAGTALGGAAVGGIAGGKKGAAIGALAGGGGGALYTYKLRKRHRRY
jgi:outer membrane lipoprotein SlyB